MDDNCGICEGEIPNHLQHLMNGNEMVPCSKCGANNAHKKCVSLGMKSNTWSCQECERKANSKKFWERSRKYWDKVVGGGRTKHISVEEVKRLGAYKKVITGLQKEQKAIAQQARGTN